MSDIEFCELSDNHQVDFQRFVDYAFNPEAGPQEYDDPESLSDRQGKQFGLFADGTLRSVCTHYDFTVSLRERWVPLAGLAALTTMPEHRRQGYVRHLIDASLHAWRGEYPLAALWPFDYEYYEQFGWATASKYAKYTCEPSALAFARDAPGTYRRVGPDDWTQLRSVNERYGGEHSLTVRRDEQWWRSRVFRSLGDEERYVYALDRDGETRGYVAYAIESGDDGRRMEVLYSGFIDHEAYRGLLGLLSNHDSQVDEVVLYRPPETSLLDMVPDPKRVDCEINPGTMVRIVEVADALETVSYPGDAVGTLTLAVTDDTADRNDGQFELSVSDGTGECRRVEDVEPEITVDVGTLTQLLVGYHSVAEARKVANITAATEDAASRLATWFPPETTGPMDNF